MPVPGLLAALPLVALAGAVGAATLQIEKLDLTGAAVGAKTDFEIPVPGGRSGYLLNLDSGRIDRYDFLTGTVDPVPYLDAIIPTAGRLQAFGLAFHPEFATPGAEGENKVYVSYAENRGRNTGAGNFVVEYTDSGRTLSAPRVVLRVEHGPADATSAGLHLGSDIGFGPDGYLHVTLGDAGGPLGGPNVAQDFTQLAGSVLRLDPLDDAYPGDPDRNYAPAPGNPAMGPGSDPAIWAGGLRNPYRANFDPVTGAYYIGDVGQEDREEINLGHAGANYGWNFREGTAPGPNSNPGPGSYTDPIYDYAHGAGPFEGIGVVGGLVYRGPLAGLRGQYLFGDLDDWYGDQVVDAIWSFDADAPACRPTACAAGASTAAPTR